MSIDPGTPNIIPTITIEDADVEQPGDGKEIPLEQSQPPLPGALPTAPAPDIPDWYKVGWRAVSGIDEPAQLQGDAKHKLVLDAFLREQYYGDWYHHAGLIVFVSSL